MKVPDSSETSCSKMQPFLQLLCHLSLLLFTKQYVESEGLREGKHGEDDHD